jgi:membrane-associated protein
MTEFLRTAIDFVLHIDVHLNTIIAAYGTGTYLLLFLIIFLETGLVVTPFLPGDSLLFAAGTFAARGSLDPALLIVLLAIAAIAGDNSNYWIGRYLGPKVFERDTKWINRKHLERAHAFYEKHGGKTVLLARFMPIIRTFAPFVAGIGRMEYRRFLMFSVSGGLLWITSMTLAGYFFGNLPFVAENFSMVVYAIIAISLMPAVIEGVRAWRAKPA